MTLKTVTMTHCKRAFQRLPLPQHGPRLAADFMSHGCRLGPGDDLYVTVDAVRVSIILQAKNLRTFTINSLSLNQRVVNWLSIKYFRFRSQSERTEAMYRSSWLCVECDRKMNTTVRFRDKASGWLWVLEIVSNKSTVHMKKMNFHKVVPLGMGRFEPRKCLGSGRRGRCVSPTEPGILLWPRCTREGFRALPSSSRAAGIRRSPRVETSDCPDGS